MDLEKVKLSLYKYKIKTITLQYGKGENTKYYDIEPTLCTGMNIVEDFEKFYFPYFTIDVSIPNSIYRQITDPSIRSTLKLKLALQKGKFKETVNISSVKGISFKTCFNKTFHAFIGSSPVDLTKEIQEIIESKESQYGQLTTFSMLLYNEHYYKKYDVVIDNRPLGKSNLTDAIGYILEKVNIKKVLMSPVTNSKSYDQFVIEPLPFCDCIKKVCDDCKPHKKGTILYFGIKRMYLIDKSPECTAYEPGESRLVYITSASKGDPANQTGGAYENTTDNYGVINAFELSFDDKSELIKKSYGSNTVSVNNKGKIVKTNKKAKTVTSVRTGSLNATSVKNTLNESKKVISCQLMNEDIDMLTINKLFIVSINGSAYKKYNGKYRLVHASHSFSKEGDYFSVSSIVQLRG